MRRTRIAAAGMAAAVVVALTAPAGASTSEVTALIGSSISISTPPSSSISFGALAVGLNSISGGSVAVSANAAYQVTVQADTATLTSWDGTTYGDDALANPLALVPTLAGGVPVVTPVAAVGTTPQAFMTGTGLTSDSASLLLEQTVDGADKPGSYRTVLTFTASEAL